ncbi:MAG: ABC transporter permease [Hyphomicrobiales bacterium]|nr:ABC transporter permease [Hyphomicrobiales bacterium]MDE2114466.1 ABC transporter permease [Hyphomicrobiales bacterium]
MRMRRAMVALSTLSALVVAWFVLTTVTGLISSGRFPDPFATWAAMRQLVSPGYAGSTLVVHVVHSLTLVLGGFMLASTLGVSLGLLMGWSRKAEAFINPIFLLLRPIPPLAWIPLAILWLGLGDAAKIMVIVIAAFVPNVINTSTGVRTIEKTVFEASQMLGTPRWRFVGEVLIPASLPAIFTGLRLSLQAAWTTLVAAELVGALAGIGLVLNVAQQDIYPAMILSAMFVVGVLGWLMTLLLGFVERRALAWRTA